MSADYITVCPRCEECELRVWESTGLTLEDKTVHVDMRFECRACDFAWSPSAAIPVPPELL